MNKIKMMLATAAVAGLAIAGCATTSVSKLPPDSAPRSPSAAPSRSPTGSPTTGPVGTTFRVNTTDNRTNQAVTYDVQAAQVLDPAQPASEFDTPDPGQHLVGVEFKITGVSGDMQSGDDDANMNAIAIGGNSQTYTPSVDSVAAGTNFDTGDFTTSPGSVSVGYVTFALPDGVSVGEVHWAEPYGSSQTAVWTVGR